MAKKKSGKAALARRYAQALFVLAQEKKQVEQAEQDLIRLHSAVETSEDLRTALNNPILSKKSLQKAFDSVLAELDASDFTKQFCALVAENRRLGLLPYIAESFYTLAAEARGEISATVTTARVLSDSQGDALKAALEKATSKKVNLNAKINEAILGGLVVQIGSRMFDDSLNGKLERLKLAQKAAPVPAEVVKH